jgi:hypothetical protein
MNLIAIRESAVADIALPERTRATSGHKDSVDQNRSCAIS